MRTRPLLYALLGALVLVALSALPARPHRAEAQSGQAIELSAGFRHTCIATTAGAVKCWGNAGQGRLGDLQGGENRVIPVDAVAVQDGIVGLAAGWGHTCGLTAEGGVRCWGNNFRGPLGNGTEVNSYTAVAVCADATCAAPLVGALEIVAGDRHTCARMPGGGIKCWGSNTQGQLGDGQACGTEACPAPVDVLGLAGPAVDVSAGISHTCAVIATGVVQCWGLNATGQLGNGTTTGSSLPVTVLGITDAVAVAAGGEHTCALRKDGSVRCWGRNADGQLGDGGACGTLCATPVAVTGLSGVARLGLGEAFGCAVLGSGALMCWGNNSEGQLGDGQACGLECALPVAPVGLGSDVIAVDAGAYHTCVLLSDGAVKCMGANGSGQLGDGSGGHFDDRQTTPVSAVGLGPADSDGDTMGDVEDTDDDNDGCTDLQEIGPQWALGGRRSPKVFWDFFDTPSTTGQRDAIIATGDILRVAQRFGTTHVPPLTKSAALAQALSTPPPSGYHAAFDRSPPSPGADPWDLNPPDGAVTIGDIFLAVIQFGHTCA